MYAVDLMLKWDSRPDGEGGSPWSRRHPQPPRADRPVPPVHQGTERVSLVRAGWAVLCLQVARHPGLQRPPTEEGGRGGGGEGERPTPAEPAAPPLLEPSSAEAGVRAEPSSGSPGEQPAPGPASLG